MTDLPLGWVKTSLGEICDRISDGSHNPPKKQSTGMPMLSAININGNSIKFDSYRLISEAEFEIEDRRTQVQADDVLLTIVGAIGRAAVVPKSARKFTLQRSVAVLRSAAMLPRLLMHHLEEPTTAKFFKENARGTAQKGIYLKTLASTPILLPPLNEQRRIVEKIEAMFDEIDKGVESLQTARTTLGLYRQSLLKSAFEGRLTADWRAKNVDKLEAPETLLARIQQERDTRYKTALDAWQDALAKWRANGEKGKKPAKPKRPADLDTESKIVLGHVVLDVAQGWSPKCENHASPAEDVWGVIKTTAIQPAKFLPQENKELPMNLQPREWLELNQGDVLITRAGPRTRVGVACMVKRTRPRLMLCDKAYRLNYLATLVLPEFLEAYINAPDTQRRIEVIKSGINDSGLNLKQEQFLALEFWLPSMAEQAEIVRIFDEKFEAADALEAEIDAALTRADALRQSILKKAFSGQLVPQNPNDEPASALLDRIKADRAKAGKTTRKRRATA
jgi:type I restriction enzyme S subunit